MAGCRPLTRPEERRLLAVVRRLPPRDRALITTQWFSALRISATMGLRSNKRSGALGIAYILIVYYTCAHFRACPRVGNCRYSLYRSYRALTYENHERPCAPDPICRSPSEF